MTYFLHKAQGPGSAGDIWISTLHSNGTVALAAAHAAWVTCFSAWVTNALGALWPNDTSCTSLITVQLDNVTGRQQAVTSSAVALAGTGAGPTLPPRDCLVLTKRTGTPTRAGRGRMYLPAPDATHLTATGLLVGTDQTAVANAIGTALTTFKATTVPSIFHYGLKQMEPIVQVAVGSVLGTQKRRTNRVTASYAAKAI